MITQTNRLDMRPGASNEVVHVSQYDNDQNTLVFDLYDNGMPWTVPSGTSVLLNGKKPDNYGFSYSAVSISGNRVVFNLTTQMTAVAGAVICELRVRNGAGTQIIGTANFILAVEPAALNDETIISDTMIPLIEQAVEIASNLDRYITQTEANAEAAQEAAETATEAAAASTIINSNVTQIYNTLEDAKTAANTAAQNANTVAANIAAAAARGDYKGDKGDKGDSGVTTPVWGMYTMYVDESTGDLWLVTNGEYGSEYWFRYDSETGLLYYCTPEFVEKTVSGELIEITDAANLGALQCKVAFSPIQSGTGDPSPSNIRPISGRTGMTVTATGKNLAVPGYNAETSLSGLTITPTTNGIRVRGTATSRRAIDLFSVAENYRHIPLAEGTKISISLYKNGDLSAVENPFVGYYANGAYAGNVGTLSAGNNYTLTWTVPERYADACDSYLRAYLYVPANATVDFEIGLQIEIGESATTYEPYAGQTYPITWESIAGTVYGGTLDVVSGVLTVDRAVITLDGTQTIGMSQDNRAYVQISGAILIDPTNQTTEASVVCDRLAPTTWGGLSGSSGDLHCSPFYGRGVAFRDDTKTTTDAWKTYFQSNPTQFSYKLATPTTYQLTPTEVRTLLGVNNIWSDGDTIEAFTYVSETYDEEG